MEDEINPHKVQAQKMYQSKCWLIYTIVQIAITALFLVYVIIDLQKQ
jgi:hypothetical protein